MAALSSYAVGLSSSQRRMVDVIEEVLGARGYPRALIAAAVTNAYAESGLNPSAVGDSGHSVGLFQLNDRGGGRGMSVADRKDPRKNTERIADEFEAVKSKFSSSASVAKLAALWSTYVERPADKAGEALKRAALATRMFPTLSGEALVEASAPGFALGAGAWVAGSAALALVLIGATRRAHAHQEAA